MSIKTVFIQISLEIIIDFLSFKHALASNEKLTIIFVKEFKNICSFSNTLQE